jgi:hypothetical protein
MNKQGNQGMAETGEQDGTKRLHQRLRRLGGRRQAAPEAAPPPRTSEHSRQPGTPITTPSGTAYLIEEEFPSDYLHGASPLVDSFAFEAELIADIARDASLSEVKREDLLFVDTETTGLAGGAGTLVFLVGIGQFMRGRFLLRQFFLRDPGQEEAMLAALMGNLEQGQAFVTFNGRNFDIPLLDMRFQMGMRAMTELKAWPHLDLLYPARRLWRNAFRDCRLGTLERDVLGVKRTEQDVPGALIPGMYVDYLRTGDAAEMQRVVYHNALDILSLVTLTGEILKRHRPDGIAALNGPEAIGVARWQQARGRNASAEEAFRAALKSKKRETRVDALRHYSAYLKQQDRRDEAAAYWMKWHDLAPEDPTPCIELAIYFEWRAGDLDLAQAWAQDALLCLSHWPATWQRDRVWGEIEHRVRRLERKQGAK